VGLESGQHFPGWPLSLPRVTHAPAKTLTVTRKPRLPPVIGYRQVWSKDRNILLQVFTDLETDSIKHVTLDRRPNGLGLWESLIEVEIED
jgi:hypothetical protein